MNFKRIIAILLVLGIVLAFIPAVVFAAEVETVPMYRLYNPWTGEHFYTGSEAERDNLTGVGWNYEGVAWNSPVSGGEPVYRVYNPWSGDHHYTMSWEEVEMLVNAGWKYENVAWNSAPEGVPQYRLWNPWADLGSHHYTSSMEERDYLVSLGWKLEGIGWYGALPEGHVHQYDSKTVEPTCMGEGYTLWYCSCGDSYKDTETAALGHKWGDWKVTKEPTTEAEGQETRTCSTCGATENREVDKLPTETESSHEHNYTKEVTAPGCELEGYTTYTCSCGYSYTDDFTEPLGHDYGEWIVRIKPTLETEGLEYRVCQRYFSEDTRCGDTQERTIDKLPEGSCEHSWGDWTSDNKGSYRSCTACGEQQVIDGSNATFVYEALAYINEYRAAANVNPVEWVDHNGAKIRAEELTITYNHQRPDGSYSTWGESVGCGYTSAKSVIDAWANSSSHSNSIVGKYITWVSVARCGNNWILFYG